MLLPQNSVSWVRHWSEWDVNTNTLARVIKLRPVDGVARVVYDKVGLDRSPCSSVRTVTPGRPTASRKDECCLLTRNEFHAGRLIEVVRCVSPDKEDKGSSKQLERSGRSSSRSVTLTSLLMVINKHEERKWMNVSDWFLEFTHRWIHACQIRGNDTRNLECKCQCKFFPLA